MIVMSERFIVLTATETHHFTAVKWITQNYNFHEVVAFSIMIIVLVLFVSFCICIRLRGRDNYLSDSWLHTVYNGPKNHRTS